jgi:two-component system sensor histidine kinase UhpB
MKAVLTGRSVNYESSYLQPDGSYNWYHVRMFPIATGDNIIQGLMAAVSNITEKKVLQQELLDQKVQEQKRITRAVINAQEKERAEIGAELHDNVNQILATSLLYMRSSLKEEEDTVFFISKAQEFVEDAQEELRKLSHVLVGPTQNTSMGLVISLEELISNISITKGIQINFDYTDYREDDFEAGLKLVIYRIIQEQINNILKYAEASLVEIVLKKEAEFLIVLINDNGKGFDTSIKSNGIGLNNISHRAAVYNGVMRLISSPGNGCKMKIIFKLYN